MTYSPVVVEKFSGLNLLDDPREIGWGGAVDLLNVDFDQRGRVRSRDGYASFATATSAVNSIFVWDRVNSGSPLASSSFQAIVGNGATLSAFNSAGTLIASTAPPATGWIGFVAFGTPSASSVYAANAADAPRKWSGAAWSTPTATVDAVAGRTMPKGLLLAVQTPDNRLVNSGFSGATDGPNGATSSPSHLYFSEAGNAESWLTTNFIQLTPGDGEPISALCAWRDLLFVFKRSKFFVFYGNSTDSSGNPVFNYRSVNTSVGAFANACVATPNGVYFGGPDGVYLTTGGPPTKISLPVDPIFTGAGGTFFTSSSTLGGSFQIQAPLAWYRNRLYINYNPASGAPILVHDPAAGFWGLYDFGGSGPIPMASTGSSLLFAVGSTSVFAHSRSSTTDAGAAITSRYRSGFNTLPPSLRADGKRVIRQWHMRGSGTVTFGVAADDAVAIPTTQGGAQSSVSLTAARPNYRTSQIGNNASWQVSATSAWRLDSLQADLA